MGRDAAPRRPVGAARQPYLNKNEQDIKIWFAEGQFAGRQYHRKRWRRLGGFNIVSISSRSYIPTVDDDEMEIRLIRAQEISRYVEHGYLDCGITGYDWVIENGSKVHEVGEFLFSKATRRPARWVLCVPENSPIKSVKDLRGKRIATEMVNLTKKYLKKRRQGRGGIFVGRDRSEGARTRGRNCRGHGNRLVTPREQAAHRGHTTGFHAAIDRQSRFMERSMETPENRDACVIAQKARLRRKRKWG